MESTPLKRSPLFARLPQDSLEALARALATRTVPFGSMVWHEGQPSDEMALVLSGALVARVGIQDVGTVRAGELVGETGVFFADPRVASVRATEETTLAVLSRNALLTLRGTHPPAYDVLLERALEVMARRVQDAGKRVALLGNGGVEPPVRKPPSVLTRLFRVGASTSDAPTTPVLPTLRKLPVLGRAAPNVLGRVAAAMKPHRLQADEVLVLEGEPGESVFVIAEGEAEIVRAVRGGKARKLATVSEGTIIGTGALLLGERRNASIRVTRPGWAWELDRASHAALDGEAGRAWRESLLVSVRHQLNQVTTSLANLQGGTSPADRARLREAVERLSAVKAQDVSDDPWSFFGKARP